MPGRSKDAIRQLSFRRPRHEPDMSRGGNMHGKSKANRVLGVVGCVAALTAALSVAVLGCGHGGSSSQPPSPPPPPTCPQGESSSAGGGCVPDPAIVITTQLTGANTFWNG